MLIEIESSENIPTNEAAIYGEGTGLSSQLPLSWLAAKQTAYPCPDHALFHPVGTSGQFVQN